MNIMVQVLVQYNVQVSLLSDYSCPNSNFPHPFPFEGSSQLDCEIIYKSKIYMKQIKLWNIIISNML